jgi:hypothetical protein
MKYALVNVFTKAICRHRDAAYEVYINQSIIVGGRGDCAFFKYFFKNTVNLNVQKKMKNPGIIIQFISYIYFYDRRHCFEFYSSALVNLIVYGYMVPMLTN